MSVFNRDKASTDQSTVTAAEVKQGQLFEGKKRGGNYTKSSPKNEDSVSIYSPSCHPISEIKYLLLCLSQYKFGTT